MCAMINGDVLNEKSKMIDILLLSGKYQSVNDIFFQGENYTLKSFVKIMRIIVVFSRDQFVDFSFDDIYGLENIKTPIRVNIITE